jgi:hypothetical protein
MKYLVLIAAFITCFYAANAQNESEPEKAPKKALFNKENAFAGGNITLSIGGGNGGLVLGANPMYGYFLNDKWDVAGVFNIQYNRFVLDATAILNGQEAQSFLIGAGVSTRVYPIDEIFLQLQPELNYISKKTKSILPQIIGPITTTSSSKARFVVPSLLIGGGYKQGFNRGKTFSYISVLFDVAGSKNSPYKNGITGTILPIFRAGVNFLLADRRSK